MQKGIILFDIDRTIFDTDAMVKDIDEATTKILKSSNLVSLRVLNKSRRFSPENYTKILCKKFKFESQEKLLEVFYSEKYEYIYKDNVFPETKVVLDGLKGDYQLGIFSEGTAKFQNNKFRSMGLNEYFDKDLIFIFDAKDTKEAIQKIPKDAIMVDDKERICEFLTKNGIKAVWLNKNDDRVSPNFPTVHNLLELPAKLM
jgi:FMN phosphatase YigB (HAD superfamily)